MHFIILLEFCLKQNAVMCRMFKVVEEFQIHVAPEKVSKRPNFISIAEPIFVYIERIFPKLIFDMI